MKALALRGFLLALQLYLGTALLSQLGRAQRGEFQVTECPKPLAGSPESELRFSDFVIRTYREPAEYACLQVLKSDRVVFSRQIDGGRFLVANGFESGANVPAIPVGSDITGRGKPNIVFVEWTGGAHCCTIFHVLEIADGVREIAQLNVEDSSDSHFADLDKNGVFELIAHDYTFAYWHGSFADSPAPPIVLRFNGVGYELALDLMRRPEPDAQELAKMPLEIEESDFPDPVLARHMLNLIYSGHPALAWKLVGAAYTPEDAAPFLKGFCGQLSLSPYFPQLRPTLVEAPCTFDPKNGERI